MTAKSPHDPVQDPAREHRRDLAIDTMASWSMEGMEPTEDGLNDIRAYVDGSVTIDELIAKHKAL